MKNYDAGEQLAMFSPDTEYGRMSLALSPAETPREKTSESSLKSLSGLRTTPYLCLDLRAGAGNLLGPCWELNSPWLGEYTTLNTGPAPHSGVAGSTLSRILEATPHPKYYLSSTACLGILRRAENRGKSLPPQLRAALELQAAVDAPSLVTLKDMARDITAFAANQRDEVRDLHDMAGAIQAQPGMKQQTFILNPWDTQQARISVPEGVSPALAGADGQGGRNPAGLILTAGVASKGNGEVFLTDEVHASLSTGGGQAGQGYPCVLCLNDQGGQRMDVYKNQTGTLRAQMDGHPPLVLFGNHGIDSRYTGPHEVSPIMSARYGTGGNNVPLVARQSETFCIAGNSIDRQPQNGGNGLGYQEDISYTLTATDHHAVFSQQRSDAYIENAVASTQSTRQYKDATDLVYQQTVGTLVASDRKGPNNQYVRDDKCVIMPTNFIRRLTPLECERLQGFTDFWTDIPGASDSARYKALGNSVAIPCVEHVLRGASFFLKDGDNHV